MYFRSQRQSSATWASDPQGGAVSWALLLVPAGLHGGWARLEIIFIFGKADEQEQNSNQLFSSFGSGLLFLAASPVFLF